MKNIHILSESEHFLFSQQQRYCPKIYSNTFLDYTKHFHRQFFITALPDPTGSSYTDFINSVKFLNVLIKAGADDLDDDKLRFQCNYLQSKYCISTYNQQYKRGEIKKDINEILVNI